MFNGTDIMAQLARCSFDIHLQEIFGSLMSGATLVMLRPRATIDFDYLSRTIKNKRITYICAVPSLLYRLFTFIETSDDTKCVTSLRSICSTGE